MNFERFSSMEDMPVPAAIMTASCKAGECVDCSGGVYRPRKIIGQTRMWFVECACDCHNQEPEHE